MAKLARQHDDLTPVVALVRHEIGQHVADVQRQVAPHVRLRRRHLAASRDAELEKRLDAVTAPPERGQQLSAPDPSPVYQSGYWNPVWLAERLQPRAPGVMQMRRDHAHRTSWRSRNGDVPQRLRQMLDDVRGNAAVRPPRGKHRRPQVVRV